MPANWRGCFRTGIAPTGREGRHRNDRDSEAASWETRRCYISMNRAAGCFRTGIREAAGTRLPRVHASAGYGAGAALNITALVSEEVKAKPTLSLATNTWSEKRIVGCSFMPAAQTEQINISRKSYGSRGRGVLTSGLPGVRGQAEIGAGG